MNSHEEALKLFEGMGIVFCQEGSEVWKSAGDMKHEIVVGTQPPWVALIPKDLNLDSDTKEAIYEVLKWCMNSGYETGN